jgi:hypothetical protein
MSICRLREIDSTFAEQPYGSHWRVSWNVRMESIRRFSDAVESKVLLKKVTGSGHISDGKVDVIQFHAVITLAAFFCNKITPRVLTEALAAGGDEARRAFDAMMGMKKIDLPRSRRRGEADITLACAAIPLLKTVGRSIHAQWNGFFPIAMPTTAIAFCAVVAGMA